MMEEDLKPALDGILSGALREADVRGEEIDTMTADIGGQGDRLQQQAEGGKP